MALLTLSRDPNTFIDHVRPALKSGALRRYPAARPHHARAHVFARYEPDLTSALFDRPRRTVLNPDWPWAVWYPLRRNGRFEQLPADEQRTILAEHGEIGMRFGAADYVHDVRLACYGLDRDDNDFVIGLLGKALFPLSAVIQAMRKTQQPSLYLDRLGPFFVGRAVWQSAGGDAK